MRTIKVELGEGAREDRSYDIIVDRGLLDRIGGAMRDMGFSGRCTLITNPTVGALYSSRVLESLKAGGLQPVVIEVPDGEEYKTLAEASKVYDRLIEERMERGSAIVALGGGVVGDMAGFVAATFLRGVPFIQVPTTLLAQVDSSVGGKTGVNHPLGKNLIGAFYQPRAVFIDPDVLETLEERELKAGLAEVIKYGVIWDEAFFSFLEENSKALAGRGGDEIVTAIERSCSIKAEVVSRDERESGLRCILNFGHTFGHAIEALTGYTRFKHGEAVSVGMVMAAALSVSLGLTPERTMLRIRDLLVDMGLPVEAPGIDGQDLVETMRLDKKVRAGAIRFVLVEEIGSVVVREVEEERIKESFALLSACSGG